MSYKAWQGAVVANKAIWIGTVGVVLPRMRGTP